MTPAQTPSESTREPEMVVSAQSTVMCVVVRIHIWVCRRVRVCVQVHSGGSYAACGRVSIHLPRHRSDVFSVAIMRVDAVRCVAAYVSQPLTACVALGIIEHLTGRVLEDGVILPVCGRSAPSASVVVAFPVQVDLCGSVVTAQVLTVREKYRVVPYGCSVHLILSIVTVFSWHKASYVTAMSLPLAKIVGVSLYLLHVCSEAMRQWLRRSPP